MTQPARFAATGRRISGRAQNADVIDPYEARHKPKEPALCTSCGAFYHRDRWQWGRSPEHAHDTLCPACRRIAEHLPAGNVTLPAAFLKNREAEIVGLIRNEEASEKREHPLNRIIDIEQTADTLVVHTTDIHLPRRIGVALHRAFHGELDIHFDERGYFVRVDWRPPV